MKKILPLSLTFTVILMDQLTKFLILATIPRRGIGASFLVIFSDHPCTKPGIAFSIGKDLPEPIRTALFTILPILVLGILGVHFFKSEEYTLFNGGWLQVS
jgi:signal peptidase II